MNRYAALSILGEVFTGKRIVVVERNTHMVREALDRFRDVVDTNDLGAKVTVRTANGAERISVPGLGAVIFTTPHTHRMRGISADVVFIDNDAHRVFEGDPRGYDRFREDLGAVLSVTGGEVIHS